MPRISDWLEQQGLGAFADVLVREQVDFETLPELTEADLKELGLPLGPRKKLLKAIRSAPSSDEAASDSATPCAPTAVAGEAQRRQLTVLFCDLVGSTALSATLDPEDTRKVILKYQDICAGVIARFEGFLARFMGDGVLAYFGYPKAHEDEAERAVRAGLALIRAVGELKAPTGEKLAARVGIATGIVVVGDLIGDGAAQEQAVVGDAPNLAARLQGIAAPGHLVIAESTRRLLGVGFTLENLGERELKGIDEPVRLTTVVGERRVESRFEAKSDAHLPMVGRDQELALLLERWSLAKNGEGQGVLLVGEAGIGKSRIGRALLDAVAEDPHVRIQYQCSPYHRDSALWPVIQQLGHAVKLVDDESAESRLDKLEALIGRAVDDVGSVAPLMASLLNLDGAARYGKLDLAPPAQRARTLEALVHQLLGIAAQQPTLLLLEDAHWIDPSTLELIGQYLDQIAAARVLIFMTSRPDQQPALAAHPHVTRLTLNRLGRGGVETIVAGLGGNRLPTSTIDAIIARTDGVPLFVEELTKAVLETGETSIPASLHDSLMARLDRISEVKEIAQTAACIGREFDFSLLAAVSDRTEASLVSSLEKLAAADLIFCRGNPPRATYTFKHALVQDAAYNSLLRSKRRSLHHDVAAALAQLFPDSATSQRDLLAHHHSLAGESEAAIACWLEAGRRATERSANREAVAHLRRGIGELEHLQASEARARHELSLQLALLTPLYAVEGFGSVAASSAYDRIQYLCETLDASEQLLPVLHGLWVEQAMRGEYSAMISSATQVAEMGTERGDETATLISHRLLGWPKFFLGELDAAAVELRRAVELYDRQRHADLRLRFGHDHLVASLVPLVMTLLARGALDRAFEKTAELMAHVRGLNHVASLAYALHGSAFVGMMAGDTKHTAPVASELTELCRRHGLPFFEAWGDIHVGWCNARDGNYQSGLELMRKGVARQREAGRVYCLSLSLATLASISLDAGKPEEAEAALEEALIFVEQTGERFWEAEIRRLATLARLARNPQETDAAETGLIECLATTRRQGARLLELRVAVSMAHLMARLDRSAEAIALLVPVYESFPEGLESPDLAAAKRELDRLA